MSAGFGWPLWRVAGVRTGWLSGWWSCLVGGRPRSDHGPPPRSPPIRSQGGPGSRYGGICRSTAAGSLARGSLLLPPAPAAARLGESPGDDRGVPLNAWSRLRRLCANVSWTVRRDGGLASRVIGWSRHARGRRWPGV